MIVTLSDTTSSAIDHRLTEMRHSGGAVALGRVLTLVVITTADESEPVIAAANDASREHPCRVIVVLTGEKRGKSRMDAEIRVGGDAGASDVVVMRISGELASHADSVVLPLLLSDAPVVAYWPSDPPANLAQDPIGKIATRRITDAMTSKRPVTALAKRREGYSEGDTDLAWTRLTLWRAALAAALDQPPYDQVTEAVVSGEASSASTELLAGWLAYALKCPVRRKTNKGPGIVSVRLERASGPVVLERPDGLTATLDQPNQPTRRLALARRKLNECLAEELRRLDPDDVYADTLNKGVPSLDADAKATAKAAPAKKSAAKKATA
ncbi:glucose-6-phosphate dehydrogenase assembly protein OpcA [Fodinicola feengrottensis]|uniref:Glucose-6-phosphate dehydrogenase assembly protein OpcA n=1 Tax=Fodinicola feengrottensis TaxID=435914 RepID=A0ABP4UWR9_9ACTN|nr:glucose-6-phosphate dehydrogenase assembly protein OpcA [Fodinicola feengrottensis]